MPQNINMTISTIILVSLALITIYLISLYNSLASLKVKIKEGFTQIDVQLKRRADLIPNLVETVKGYASHEKEIFENVSKARSAMLGATGVEQKEQANNQMTQALKSLFAVAEAYPELKASENFTKLQEELSHTEDKVAYSRQFFNSIVSTYNQKIVVFPTSIVAGIFGFKEEKFFEIDQSDREEVKVDFKK